MEEPQMNETDLLFRSPKRPGRPMATGQTTFKRADQTEVSDLKEEVSIRFHLGYCQCGRDITAGYNRMGYILQQLERRHFPRKAPQSMPIRHKIGKFLLKGAKE